MNVLRFGVALGDKPAAAGRVIPPLALDAQHVFPHVQILPPGGRRSLVGGRSLGDSSAKAKLADVTRSTIRTRQQNHSTPSILMPNRRRTFFADQFAFLKA